MRSENGRKVAWGVVIAVAVGFTLPLIFGEPRKIKDQEGGDPWRNFIYDFQTLFTGVFAIAAAYATVRQMQKSDARSDERHAEAMRLATRADRLRVERSLFPQIYALEDCLEEWPKPFVELPRFENVDDDVLTVVKQDLKVKADSLNETLEMFKKPTWIEGQNLLSGLGALGVSSFIEHAEQVVLWIAEISDYIVSRPDVDAPLRVIAHYKQTIKLRSSTELHEMVANLEERASWAKYDLIEVVDSLRSLREEYGLNNY